MVADYTAANSSSRWNFSRVSGGANFVGSVGAIAFRIPNRSGRNELASLGGAYLTLVHVNFFVEGMSAGKGFIALAALIFGRWHPVSTAFACLLFGATEAL